MTDTKVIAAALSAPFDPKDIKFKPQMVKQNRALAMAYITSRAVMDRLDEVAGAENWQDSYELLPGGSVVCTLSVSLGGQWVSKVDVGNPSEQPDDGDKVKAAFSDALKRAAVKWGIGRYLYRLPAQWCDYDPVKKQFTSWPQLPAFALPRGEVSGREPSAPVRKVEGARPEPGVVWDVWDGSNVATMTTEEVWALVRGGAKPETLRLKPSGVADAKGKTADAWGFTAKA
jgi:hypothetical protein